MTTYIALLTTLIGGISGLAGSSWDQSKKGALKFTKRGWISLVVILLGFLLSAYSTYINQTNAEYEKMQRQHVANIGREELEFALRHTFEPFVKILVETGHGGKFQGLRHRQYYKKALSIIASEEGRKIFENFDLERKPSDDVSGTFYGKYSHAISHAARVAPLRLDRIFEVYSNFLPPEDLVLLRKLFTHNFYIEMSSVYNELDSPKFL